MAGSNEKKGIKADFNLATILIIPVAIAINFIAGTLVGTLRLPIYLDSIGTFLIAMLAGPWVGCVTGFLSISINSIADPSLIPYIGCGAITGFITGYMARKGLACSFKKLIAIIVAVSAASVILSIFITVTVFGGFATGGTSMIAAGLISAGVPFWGAEIVANTCSEVPDKFVSLLIAWFVIKGMSDRYLYKFSNGSIFINSRKEK